MTEPGAGQIRVLLFAIAREAIGQSEISVPVPAEATVADLRQALAAAYPALGELLGRVMIAVNQEYGTDTTPVRPGDEVAVIPPVSGGNRPRLVTEEPLELAPLIDQVASPGAGAIVTFLGVVRDENLGARVRYLEYEAYVPMAERELEGIVAETTARWPGCRVAVTHRTGRLEICEPSVAIAVAAPHRTEAFEACRHVIDTLKERVPIWKREHIEGGTVWIETEASRRGEASPDGAPG